MYVVFPFAHAYKVKRENGKCFKGCTKKTSLRYLVCEFVILSVCYYVLLPNTKELGQRAIVTG